MKILYYAQQKWLYNANGFPDKPQFKGDYFLHYGPQKQYEEALQKAIAEAIPLVNADWIAIMWEDELKDGMTFMIKLGWRIKVENGQAFLAVEHNEPIECNHTSRNEEQGDKVSDA